MENPEFNQKLIVNLATAALREQRARRRWGVFFKLLFFAYIAGFTWLYAQDREVQLADGGPHTAVIKLHGSITADGDNAADQINPLLRAAFADSDSKGVILQINSPGGSVVESNRIYNEIRRLRAQHPDKKIIAVAGDMCASGGYYIASAADDIYADPGSIVGSIGVIFSSFGLVNTLDKLGIERRVQTAGDNKNLFDPFLPQDADGQAVIADLLTDTHALFLDAVREGRGDRLKDDPRIFNGTVFSGRAGMALGLIDGFNDTAGTARDIIGTDNLRYYQHGDWIDSFADKLGAAISAHLLPIPPSGLIGEFTAGKKL